jgi:hypothetical protein
MRAVARPPTFVIVNGGASIMEILYACNQMDTFVRHRLCVRLYNILINVRPQWLTRGPLISDMAPCQPLKESESERPNLNSIPISTTAQPQTPKPLRVVPLQPTTMRHPCTISHNDNAALESRLRWQYANAPSARCLVLVPLASGEERTLKAAGER